MKILITCEHASNDIPEKYEKLLKSSLDASSYRDFKRQLKTHRGYDIGALEIATRLYFDLKSGQSFKKSNLEFIAFKWFAWSRLLIDPNRSSGHKNLFSEWSKKLNPKIRKEIKNRLYVYYRFEIDQIIRASKGQPCFHIAVHSFTPVLNGKKRNSDIGFLYDAGKRYEKVFTDSAVALLRTSNLTIRRNYPYHGKSDGLTTDLRKKYKNYGGVEIEINQSIVKRHKKYYNALHLAVNESLLLLDRTVQRPKFAK